MHPSSTTRDKLRTVLASEKSDVNQRFERYKTLTLKIADYQVGNGPAPTEDEFNQWLADVQHTVDLKKMIGAN